jgi:hypothetical protein
MRVRVSAELGHGAIAVQSPTTARETGLPPVAFDKIAALDAGQLGGPQACGANLGIAAIRRDGTRAESERPHNR